MYSGTSPDSAHSSSASSYVSTSLEHPGIQHNAVHDAFESVYERRKSWRTLSGGEVIWPPELEAALLEGLEVYKPDDSRETRVLGRFPMRNQFLSEYIFRKTGKHRSPKQVSSRLQQLRDTCSSQSLMKLLQPCRPPARRYPSCNSNDSACYTWSSPLTPLGPSASLHLENRAAQSSRMVVYIDILPNNQSQSYQRYAKLNEDHWERDVTHSIVRLSPHARHLRSINPTITFVSPAVLSAYSLFAVYSAGTTVFSGTSRLSATGPAPGRTDGAILYSTTLVPEFWQTITESSGEPNPSTLVSPVVQYHEKDPTRYTIFQDIVLDGQQSSCVFSAAYKFVYPAGTTSDILTAPFMEPFDGNRLLDEPQMSLPINRRPTRLGHNTDFTANEAESYGGNIDVGDRCVWGGWSPTAAIARHR